MAIPFQYESEYKRKLCTPDEAARVVKSGDWLDISMGCAFPSLMDAAIAKRKEELYGVKIRGYLIQQPIQMVECDPGREHFIYNSWHMSGYERKLCDRGLFLNDGGTVKAKLSRESFYCAQGETLVDEAFGGSLPAFFAAFTKRRALSRAEIQEIQRMIDEAEG